jgi:hypothetical protein
LGKAGIVEQEGKKAGRSLLCGLCVSAVRQAASVQPGVAQRATLKVLYDAK